MMERFLELPLGWAFLALWCGVMVRANGTYWIGRGVLAGTNHSRFAYLLESSHYLRAQELAARWGILAVPLSFLTVGLQTFVQLSAGVTRMPLRHYLPAVMVGCAIWASIYATVGMAVFFSWLESGGHWLIPAVLLALAVGLIWLRSRKQSTAASAATAGMALDQAEPAVDQHELPVYVAAGIAGEEQDQPV